MAQGKGKSKSQGSSFDGLSNLGYAHVLIEVHCISYLDDLGMVLSANSDFSLLSPEHFKLNQPLTEAEIMEGLKNPESPIFKTAIFLEIEAAQVDIFIHLMIARTEIEIETANTQLEKKEQAENAIEYQASLSEMQKTYQPEFLDPKTESQFSGLQTERDALLEFDTEDDLINIQMMNWHLLQNYGKQTLCLLENKHPEGLIFRSSPDAAESQAVHLKFPTQAPDIQDISSIVKVNPNLLSQDQDRLSGLASHYAHLSTGVNLVMQYLFVMLRIPENQAQLAKAGYPDPDLIPSSVLKPLIKDIDQVIKQTQNIPGNHAAGGNTNQTIISALTKNNESILNKLQIEKQEDEQKRQSGGLSQPKSNAH